MVRFRVRHVSVTLHAHCRMRNSVWHGMSFITRALLLDMTSHFRYMRDNPTMCQDQVLTHNPCGLLLIFVDIDIGNPDRRNLGSLQSSNGL